MMQQVETAEAAYHQVIEHMQKNGHTIIATNETNFSRYRIMTTNKGRYLVMFKKEFFRNFGREFARFGETGLGDSINIKGLKEAVISGAMNLIFIYPNGAIYTISISDFLLKSHRWTNKENTEVRSISVHNLKRENGE